MNSATAKSELYEFAESKHTANKQVNKSLLNFRNLNETEKTRESNKIDFEASRLKNEWTQKLQQKDISII